ncbi:hypothetical protein ACFTAO_09000 [Paenibacillus rhizoplanae]
MHQYYRGSKKWSLGTYYPQLELDEQKLALWKERHVLNQPECKGCNIAFSMLRELSGSSRPNHRFDLRRLLRKCEA